MRQCGIPAGGLIASALLPWLAHMWSWRWALVVAGALTITLVLPLSLSPLERGDELERVVSGPIEHPARDRNIRLLTLWGCLVVTGQYTILAFLALDLHQSAGLSLVSASLLVAVANAMGIVGRIAWGTISDHALSRGRKPLLLLLNVTGLVSAVALLATPRSAPVGVFVVLAALGGFALIGYQGLWITLLAEMAGPRRVGVATGFAVTFVQISIALTPPLYGLVADWTGSYRSVWAVLCCLLLLALVPAMLDPRARRARARRVTARYWAHVRPGVDNPDRRHRDRRDLARPRARTSLLRHLSLASRSRALADQDERRPPRHQQGHGGRDHPAGRLRGRAPRARIRPVLSPASARSLDPLGLVREVALSRVPDVG